MTGTIVVAPFSNSEIRDWQPEHFAALIGHLVDRIAPDMRILVIGTKSQRLRACEIVRAFSPLQVVNSCGRLTWPQVLAEVRAAACVIGNNSGIAHLSSFYRVPTVCVFGGSHQRLEWRPIAPDVITISRAISCSPCHLDHGASCRYDKLCLQQIDPAVVADAALSLLDRHGADGERRHMTRRVAGESGR